MRSIITNVIRAKGGVRFRETSKCIPTLRLLVGCSLISVSSMAAVPSKTLAHLPNTGINAIKVDTAENIYVAGFQRTLDTPDSYDAYVTTLSPDRPRPPAPPYLL